MKTAAVSLIDISTMARLYGVTPRALRFYEQFGLLRPIREGATRLYSPGDRIRLESILKGKRLGLSLSEIATLLNGQDKDTKAIGTSEDILIARMGRNQIDEQLSILCERRAVLNQAIRELKTALSRASDRPVNLDE